MQTYKIIEDDYVLITQPKLSKVLGRTRGQIVSQINYWIQKGCGKSHDGMIWIYNTEEEWGNQLSLSKRQIRNQMKTLSKMGIITIKKLQARHYDQTNFVTINYDVLYALLDEHFPPQSDQKGDVNLASPKRKKVPPLYTKKTNKDINKTNKSEEFFDFEKKEKENRGGDHQNFEHIHNVKTLKQKEAQTQENPTIIQDMLEIWNEVFPEKKSVLTKQLAQYFYAAYQKKFNQNLDEWRQYLKKIQSSTYLTGKNFNLSLHWVLKFLTIDRILNGELGVKTNIIETDQKDFKQKVDEHFRTLQEPEYIRQFRLNLLEKVGAAIYSNVFLNAIFERLDNTIVFKSTPFFENYVHQKYGHLLKTLNDQRRLEGKGSIKPTLIFENNKDLNLENGFSTHNF